MAATSTTTRPVRCLHRRRRNTWSRRRGRCTKNHVPRRRVVAAATAHCGTTTTILLRQWKVDILTAGAFSFPFHFAGRILLTTTHCSCRYSQPDSSLQYASERTSLLPPPGISSNEYADMYTNRYSGQSSSGAGYYDPGPITTYDASVTERMDNTSMALYQYEVRFVKVHSE
jgi:hypothetical protein